MSQNPSPPEPRAAEPSPDSLTDSQAGSRFEVDAGPAFDAGDLPPVEERAPSRELVAGEPVPLWEEDRVRQLLNAQGSMAHGLLAVDKTSTEWVYTEEDLKAIAGPLTNILNRYEPTRAAAAAGDELALAIGFGGYAMRSWRERMIALQDQEASVELVPIAGAPEGSDGRDDPEHMAHLGHVPDPDSTPAPIGGRR